MDFSINMKELNKYTAGLPYPNVIIDKPNLHYAALVSGAFAGKGSEMTAITQYTAHNFFTEDYPNIYTAYKYITFSETIHLRLLGRVIKKYGRHPIFASYEDNRYWEGSFPVYAYEIKEILKSDIQGEKNAIAHYQRLITQINNESVQNLFRRIILDEEKHLEILSSLYAGLN